MNITRIGFWIVTGLVASFICCTSTIVIKTGGGLDSNIAISILGKNLNANIKSDRERIKLICNTLL